MRKWARRGRYFDAGAVQTYAQMAGRDPQRKISWLRPECQRESGAFSPTGPSRKAEAEAHGHLGTSEQPIIRSAASKDGHKAVAGEPFGPTMHCLVESWHGRDAWGGYLTRPHGKIPNTSIISPLPPFFGLPDARQMRRS